MTVACEPMPYTATPNGLEQLFWAHQERVLRAAYRITGNMADAEDVAQNVFIRLAGIALQGIENPGSYLYRAAINGALDLVRRRTAELGLDAAEEAVTTLPEGSPERQLSSLELRQWLRDALAKLAPVEAEMFVLRYIDGRDNREIARMIGTSRAVVAVRLHQVRSKLKKNFVRSFEAKK
jgi:RNA polymerase sigma factor (sigma-70 family)